MYSYIYKKKHSVFYYILMSVIRIWPKIQYFFINVAIHLKNNASCRTIRNPVFAQTNLSTLYVFTLSLINSCATIWFQKFQAKYLCLYLLLYIRVSWQHISVNYACVCWWGAGRVRLRIWDLTVGQQQMNAQILYYFNTPNSSVASRAENFTNYVYLTQASLIVYALSVIDLIPVTCNISIVVAVLWVSVVLIQLPCNSYPMLANFWAKFICILFQWR